MKNLVIYDSQFGNTEKIAHVIAKSVSAKIIKVDNINISDLNNIDLLIVGSPTQGGRPTIELQNFLKQIPSGTLKNIKVTAFDTRFLEKDLNLILKLLVRTIGYAAPKIADILTSKGGRLNQLPTGFIVKGKKGPLATGELERAEKWIKI